MFFILLSLAALFIIVSLVKYGFYKLGGGKATYGGFINGVCAHGVIGGQKEQLCTQCVEDNNLRLANIVAASRQQELLSQISKRVKEVREREYRRLFESYLIEIDFLLQLTPQKFEDVIADLYRRLGYTVVQTSYTNDRGRDAIATRDGETYYIECKRYEKSRTVGRRDLQIFFAAIVEGKAAKGFFVTTARFKETAREFVHDKQIELVDGEQLVNLFRSVGLRSSFDDSYEAICEQCGLSVRLKLSEPSASVACQNGHKVRPSFTLDFKPNKKRQESSSLIEVVFCKKCGSRMRLIDGKFGKFWGCSNYPTCTYKSKFQKR